MKVSEIEIEMVILINHFPQARPTHDFASDHDHQSIQQFLRFFCNPSIQCRHQTIIRKSVQSFYVSTH
jgi:hypothetical protein